MHVRMYMCVSAFVCMYICLHACLCVYCMYVRMCVCVYAYMYVHKHECILCVCVCVCMCVVCVCKYVPSTAENCMVELMRGKRMDAGLSCICRHTRRIQSHTRINARKRKSTREKIIECAFVFVYGCVYMCWCWCLKVHRCESVSECIHMNPYCQCTHACEIYTKKCPHVHADIISVFMDPFDFFQGS